MKKVISFAMILSLIFAFAGCGNKADEKTVTSQSAQNEAVESNSDTEQAKEETPSANKSIVIYFSRAGEQYGVGVIDKGNTAIIAEMIAESTGSDIFEIEPTDNRYDLSYNDLTDYAKKEQNVNARPEYKGSVDLSAYDTVYLGYPIWWGDLPMIVYTFLENNDFSGKTVYGFCTHAGSGSAGTGTKLANTLSGSYVNTDILAIAGTTAQNEQSSAKQSVEEWLSEIG